MLVQEHHQHAGWKISLYAKRWSHLPSISQALGELWPAGTYIYELDHHFNITTPWCQNPGQRTFNKSYITDPSFQTLNSKSMPITSLQVIRSLSSVGRQVQPVLGAWVPDFPPDAICVSFNLRFFLSISGLGFSQLTGYLNMVLQEVNGAFEIGCLLSNQDFLRNKATVFCQIVQILSSSQQRMEPQLTMGAARCHWFANNTLPLSPGTEIINLLK